MKGTYILFGSLARMPTALSANAEFQSAHEVVGASSLIVFDNEPPPQLIVDAPLPAELAEGRVYIQYQTENIRILTVFGSGALDVSPRLGQLHITVDDALSHFVDTSGETIVIVGLEAGPHSVLVRLADPTHRVMAQQRLTFDVPKRWVGMSAPAVPR
jgi:Family of unknown function (DUF6130)